jgi:surfactin synthase thioesterase subunit
LQAILRDKDFFVKRGLERFSCKLAHHQYDYELKNFNGEHFYILDKTKGIPEELQNSV